MTKGLPRRRIARGDKLNAGLSSERRTHRAKGSPHVCCGAVKGGCCDASVLSKPAFNPSAAPVLTLRNNMSPSLRLEKSPKPDGCQSRPTEPRKEAPVIALLAML